MSGKNRKAERRLTAPAGTELRLAKLTGVQVRAEGDGPIPFKGHAAVFDSRTRIGGRWGWYEEIARTAFDSALARPDDVRLLKNHNEDLILARTTASNLRLSTDDIGLYTEADMTPTTYARDLALSLDAGDVTQMSFAFRVLKDEWSVINVGDEENEAELRTILDVELWDVSPVTYPAYVDTDASLRAREMDLVCRSLGFDDPDTRHQLATALQQSEPDPDLAASLRAAASRLTERAETLGQPASSPDDDGRNATGDALSPTTDDIRRRFTDLVHHEVDRLRKDT